MEKNKRSFWKLPDRIDYFIFGIYCVLLAIVLRKHEPWADEAQAWLLARDSGFFELLFDRLRYEGHPGLWYLILMMPSKILPYYPTIQIITFLIVIAGVFVFLRNSPFPRIAKIMFPFTYFIFYQYAVIARSYVLLPLLIFLIGTIYPRKFDRVYIFTLLNCLLAYTSVFSALIAISVMFVHFLDTLKSWTELSEEDRERQTVSFSFFAIFLLFMAIQLRQPSDSSFAKNYHFEFDRIRSMFVFALDAVTFENKWISFPIVIISCVWFWSRRVLLLYLLSSLAIISLFAIKYYNDWHQGILFLAWILPIWISFQRSEKPSRIRLISLKKLATTAILITFLLHIFWSFTVSIADYRGSYSGGKAIANYIRENNLSSSKICATSFWSTAILPFFDQNIFANHNDGEKPSFWFWMIDNKHDDNLDQILARDPELIIIGRPSEDLKIDGYEKIGLFESNLYWKDRIKEQNHFAVYRREN